MTKLEKLLPCPFCGKQPQMEHNMNIDAWVVWCQRGADHHGDFDRQRQESAIKAWNRRAGK